MEFIVTVEGKLTVTADNAEDAKKLIAARLIGPYAWLTSAYGDPKPIAHIDGLPAAPIELCNDTLSKDA